MALKYNTETSVPRDIKTQSEIETEFLNQENIVGRESDIQTNAWSITATTTLSYDVVITGCALNVECADDSGNSNGNASATFKGFTLGNIIITGDNSTGLSGSLFVPIPNWLVKAGEVITINTGGSDGTGRVVVIGYRL